MGTSLTGKIVLIVGGTTGIGRATAELFAARGAVVTVAGRGVTEGERVAAAIRSAGGSAAFRCADVSDAASIEALVRDVARTHGRLDIAFNNAGRELPWRRTADISEADFEAMVDLKLTGLWRCLKYELAQMTRQGRGVIVNMAGNWGLKGAPGYASYCAAAHGIMGLTRTAALEYARDNIRVNAVCPGAVDTALLDRMVGGDAELKASLARAVPLGRLAQPDDVARAVAWLSSDEAAYVTGQGIVLAGGA
jgi:NAD(P)-dependent dehydrogenase (short-subunit alcohol dehydrogenase family)